MGLQFHESFSEWSPKQTCNVSQAELLGFAHGNEYSLFSLAFEWFPNVCLITSIIVMYSKEVLAQASTRTCRVYVK